MWPFAKRWKEHEDHTLDWQRMTPAPMHDSAGRNTGMMHTMAQGTCTKCGHRRTLHQTGRYGGVYATVEVEGDKWCRK